MKVEGHSNLIRDEHSSAIVSTDYNGYLAVKKRRELQKKTTEDINTLKEEVGQMKNLITTLIEKLNGKDS